MTRRLTRWLLILVILVLPAVAQDQSGAEASSPDSILKGYEANIRSVFGQAFEGNVEAGAIVLPSFETEYAVGLRRGTRGHEIFLIRASARIWSYTSAEMMRQGHVVVVSGDRNQTSQEIERVRRSVPPRVTDVPTDSCSAAIDEETAAAVVRAWRQMLLSGGLDQRSGGFDGVTTRFFMKNGERQVEGETWGGGPPEIVDAMADYCSASRRASRIASGAGALLAVLAIIPLLVFLGDGLRRRTGGHGAGVSRLESALHRHRVTFATAMIALALLLVCAGFAGGNSRELLGIAQVVASAR